MGRHGGADALLERIRDGELLTTAEQVRLIFLLSLPAMASQAVTTIMQYIDASMVGQLGSAESASIGLVSSSTWVFFWTCTAATTGFNVQVAQLVGARKFDEARAVLLQAIAVILGLSVAMSVLGMSVSQVLPRWLGGSEEIVGDASAYFAVAMASIPFLGMNYLGCGMLQCSGNMRLPAIINVMSCVLDVVFNSLFIFPTRSMALGGLSLVLPGLGLGVAGAALGTASATTIAALVAMWSVLRRSDILRIRRGDRLRFEQEVIANAIRISTPVALENLVMSGALVITTRIVAPLGSVAIAANSFSVTAEGLCYMPGYGIGAAATTLVGQSIGARRKWLSRRLAWLTTGLGVGIMTLMATLMYLFAPQMIGLLTPDPAIRALGTAVLRIEAFAEPMYAASIVASGSLRGAGDTLVPFLLNFGSLWLVRIPLSAYLAPIAGLPGVWVAMCIELNVRGILLLLRLRTKGWSRRAIREE